MAWEVVVASGDTAESDVKADLDNHVNELLQ